MTGRFNGIQKHLLVTDERFEKGGDIGLPLVRAAGDYENGRHNAA